MAKALQADIAKIVKLPTNKISEFDSLLIIFHLNFIKI